MSSSYLSPFWRKFAMTVFGSIILIATVYDDVVAQDALEEVWP